MVSRPPLCFHEILFAVFSNLQANRILSFPPSRRAAAAHRSSSWSHEVHLFSLREQQLRHRFVISSSIHPSSLHSKELTFIFAVSSLSGYNAFISLGARTRLTPGAVIDRKAGLSIAIGHTGTPVSLQISLLRGLLEGKKNGSALEEAFVPIISGDAPLILKVHSADQVSGLSYYLPCTR